MDVFLISLALTLAWNGFMFTLVARMPSNGQR
jgi:hypothetical protein